jgi:hypothetical protein
MTQKAFEATRRVKLLRVSGRMLLEFLRIQSGPPESITVWRYDIPEGAEVTWCAPGQFGACIDLYVWHESFDPVPIGEQPPTLGPLPLWAECYALATHEELVLRAQRDPDHQERVAPPLSSTLLPGGLPEDGETAPYTADRA